jgi:putative ABC transport system permease protein
MISALFSDLSIALRNVLRQRGRSSAAIGALVFGVTALLLAGGFIEWMFFGMREWTIHSQLGHIQVMRTGYLDKGRADPFAYLLPQDAKELSEIGSLPEAKVVGPRLAFNGLISRGDVTVSFIGVGARPEQEPELSRTLEITQGQGLSNDEPRGVVLGRGLAANLGAGVGDTVVLMANTGAGSLNAVECRVRGLFGTVSKAYDDAALRLPLATAEQLLRVAGAHTWIVLLQETGQTAPVLQALRAKYAGGPLQFVPWNDLADLYNKTVALFSRQVAVLKLIVAIIIVLSVSNTMTRSVIERTGEIGTAMALGLRRRQVLRLFLLEGGLLGLAGALLGLLLGGIAAYAISAVGIPMPPPPGSAQAMTGEIMLTAPLARDALLLAVGAAVAASLYPAWKASRLPIVDALRHNR